MLRACYGHSSQVTSTCVSPIPARRRCISSRRSIESRGCGRCSPCSRASSPEWPTGTGAWPSAQRRRSSTSGPGLANGLANLHNARRAATPIVNIVGDHATYHAQYDAPLASDIAGFARPVSGWLHASTSARSVAADGARAVQAARQAPGQIATLIVPADVAWSDAEREAAALHVAPPAPVSSGAVSDVVAALRNGKPTALLLRGASLRGDGLAAAGRIAAATGARLLCDTFAPRLERGAGRVSHRAAPVFRRTARRRARIGGATDPGRIDASRRVLRLSGQAELVLARRRCHHPAGPPARGRRRGAHGGGRHAGRPFRLDSPASC